MKIFDTRPPRNPLFSEMPCGTIFCVNWGDDCSEPSYCIKISDVEYADDVYNAVDLVAGELYFFDKDDCFEVIDCELHIK